MLLLGLFSQAAFGEEAFDLLSDDDDFSFEAPASQAETAQTVEHSPLKYSLDHSASVRLGGPAEMVNHRSGLNLEYAGPLSESTYTKVDVTGSLYWSQDHQAKTKKKQFDADGLIREAWVQKSDGQLSYKLGFQSIVWGDVEGSQATDTLNPVDNREFLFVDFEDVRIGQGTLSVAGFGDKFSFEAFVTPTPGYNKNPPTGSIYAPANPFAGLPVRSDLPQEPEYGFRGKGKIGLAEAALLLAKLTPNQSNFELTSAGLLETAAPFWLVGLNLNYPIGQTLLKADVGYKTDQGINNQTFGLVHKDRLDTALGIESTIEQHSIFASVTVNNVMQWEPGLVGKPQSGYYNLGWSKAYLHDDLTLNLGGFGMLNAGGQILNGQAQYQINDQWQVSTALFVIQVTDSDSPFYAFKDEHRLECKAKVQF